MPAKPVPAGSKPGAGIKSFQGILDSRFRGSDGGCGFFRNLLVRHTRRHTACPRGSGDGHPGIFWGPIATRITATDWIPASAGMTSFFLAEHSNVRHARVHLSGIQDHSGFPLPRECQQKTGIPPPRERRPSFWQRSLMSVMPECLYRASSQVKSSNKSRQ
jgi:hypothetical protein